jgi:flagellar basal body rod protein FlgG
MDGIAWASSAMVAARTRLEIATANLANASTDGFRKHVARGRLTASGVEVDPLVATAQGALRRTGRDFDFAIAGDGWFRVRDGSSIRPTRDGAFVRDRDGRLRDDAGRALQGRHGDLIVPAGASVDERGAVVVAGRVVDSIALPSASALRTGFLETANTDAVTEMVDVMAAQRSFESAEKVVATIDAASRKAAGDVAALK